MTLKELHQKIQKYKEEAKDEDEFQKKTILEVILFMEENDITEDDIDEYWIESCHTVHKHF